MDGRVGGTAGGLKESHTSLPMHKCCAMGSRRHTQLRASSSWLRELPCYRHWRAWWVYTVWACRVRNLGALSPPRNHTHLARAISRPTLVCTNAKRDDAPVSMFVAPQPRSHSCMIRYYLVGVSARQGGDKGADFISKGIEDPLANHHQRCRVVASAVQDQGMIWARPPTILHGFGTYHA